MAVIHEESGRQRGAIERSGDGISVRAAIPVDYPVWLRMRRALWPEATADEHSDEIAHFFAREARLPGAAFLAFDASGAAIGFAELSIRSAAEGCTSGWVGYLEGWYVEPRARRRGAGRALIWAAETWAYSQGCREFASDTQYGNAASALAHAALGFTEVEQLRCFRKTL
jgi:aminoglycoside 6'-N-acetyltransferase I